MRIYKNVIFCLALISAPIQGASCKFSIIVPPVVSEDLFETLASLTDQRYINWHLYAINNGSLKAKEVRDFMQKHESCLTVASNSHRQELVQAVYTTGLSCPDQSVILILLPGQIFANQNVLAQLAELYEDSTVWAASGNYQLKGLSGKRIAGDFPLNIYQDNTFRSHKAWCIGLPFTCRAWLLKQIKLGDLIDRGHFYGNVQKAYLFPLLEMAGKEHYRFIDDILCIQHSPVPAPSEKEKQQERLIRSKRKYQPLAQPVTSDKQKARLIVYSKDRPLQLYAFLESCYAHVTGAYEVVVIYATSNSSYGRAYDVLKAHFPQAIFHHQRTAADLKALTLASVYQRAGDYVAFAVDDIIIKDAIDLDAALMLLELTGAHGFYLRLGKNITHCYSVLPRGAYTGTPPLLKITPTVYAWQFMAGRGEWRQICTLDMTLYRKRDIRGALESLRYHTPNELEATWEQFSNFSLIGLCPVTSQIVNIPLNLVQTYSKNRNMALYTPVELLSKFNAGLKMDIRPLFKINNSAPHMEHNPRFIKR